MLIKASEKLKGGGSSRKLKLHHPELIKPAYMKNALWSPRYFAGSVGGTPISVVQTIHQATNQTPLNRFAFPLSFPALKGRGMARISVSSVQNAVTLPPPTTVNHKTSLYTVTVATLTMQTKMQHWLLRNEESFQFYKLERCCLTVEVSELSQIVCVEAPLRPAELKARLVVSNEASKRKG